MKETGCMRLEGCETSKRENKELIVERWGPCSVTGRGGRASKETGKAWLVSRRGSSPASGACI